MQRLGALGPVLFGAVWLFVAGHTPLVPDPPQTQQARPGAQATPQRDAPKPKAGKATIRGRVIAADTGAPLARAYVELTPDGGSTSARDLRRAQTNLDGAFEYTNLPAGRYRLYASKGPYVRMAYGQRRSFGTGNPIDVAEGQKVEKVDLSLPRGGVITGRVLDDIGEPATGVQVSVGRIRYLQGRRILGSTSSGRSYDETDDLGRYRLYGLLPGRYFVRSQADTVLSVEIEGVSTRPLPTYYPGTATLAEAEAVLVRLGEEQQGIDFQLVVARSARVSGSAVDSRGRPVAGAWPTLWERPYGSGRTGFGTTRLDGAFSIPSVLPGDYTVSVERETTESGATEYGRTDLTVTGADLTGILVVVGPGARLSGRVVFAGETAGDVGSSRLTVEAQPSPGSAGHMIGRGKVSADGTFQIPGMEPGPRLIRVSGLPSGWYLDAVLLDGKDVTDSQIQCGAGESVEGMVVRLTDQVTSISGVVLDGRERPLSEAAVIVYAEDTSRWAYPSRHIAVARPNAKGQYQVKGLPAGRYLAVAVDDIEEGEEYDPDLLEDLRRSAVRLTLERAESVIQNLIVTTSRD